MGPRWYVCEARPREEKTAREQIFELGFEVILPTYLRKCRVRRRDEKIEAPVFGPYLFVRFDQAQDLWAGIVSARGVKRLFCGDGARPVPLPHAVGRDLVERFSTLPLPGIDAVLDLIQVGLQVSIVDGPFAGHVGICRRSTEARITLLLSIFGAKREVELDMRSVLPVS
jgi:transcriptional antiterminator RfaH